jgi:hypothetical protein
VASDAFFFLRLYCFIEESVNNTSSRLVKQLILKLKLRIIILEAMQRLPSSITS